MFSSKGFLRLNIIFYLIQQLMILPNMSVHALLDFETKEFLSGKVIRAALFHYPPSVIIKKETDGTFSYDGTSIDVLNYFASAYNLTLEYVHIKLTDLKKYGLVPAQINLILNDEADIFAIGLVASPLAYSQVDISVPVMMEPFRLIVPWPEEESRLLAPIRPFQPIVWMCLGGTLFVLAPTLAFLAAFYSKYITKRNIQEVNFESVSRNTLFLLSHLTNHGYHLRLNSRPMSALAGLWMLMTVVLANGYAGTLFSFLSVAKLEPIINSLDELANSTEVQLVTQARTLWVGYMMDAKSGKEKIIADSLRKDPTNQISTIEEAETKLMTGKYAFAYFDMFNIPLINSTYKKSGNKCRLARAKEPISFFSPVSHGLAKNGPYSEAYNKQVQAQVEAGLVDHYIKSRMPRIDQCLIKNQEASARQKGLTMVDMSSAFVILGLGLSLALLVFLLELIYKRFRDHYFTA